jgi:hypothetical protein
MKNSAKLMMIVILIINFSTVYAQKQYKTAKEAIASLYDYNESDGTLKVIKDGDSPVITLSSFVISNETQKNVEETLKRTCVSGALRVFIHTNAKSVIINAQTILKGTKKVTKKLSLKLTREKALECINKLLGASKFSELVKKTQFGDEKSDKFNNGFYNDKKPGLDALFSCLSK